MPVSLAEFVVFRVRRCSRCVDVHVMSHRVYRYALRMLFVRVYVCTSACVCVSVSVRRASVVMAIAFSFEPIAVVPLRSLHGIRIHTNETICTLCQRNCEWTVLYVVVVRCVYFMEPNTILLRCLLRSAAFDQQRTECRKPNWAICMFMCRHLGVPDATSSTHVRFSHNELCVDVCVGMWACEYKYVALSATHSSTKCRSLRVLRRYYGFDRNVLKNSCTNSVILKKKWIRNTFKIRSYQHFFNFLTYFASNEFSWFFATKEIYWTCRQEKVIHEEAYRVRTWGTLSHTDERSVENEESNFSMKTHTNPTILMAFSKRLRCVACMCIACVTLYVYGWHGVWRVKVAYV